MVRSDEDWSGAPIESDAAVAKLYTVLLRHEQWVDILKPLELRLVDLADGLPARKINSSIFKHENASRETQYV